MLISLFLDALLFSEAPIGCPVRQMEGCILEISVSHSGLVTSFHDLYLFSLTSMVF